MITIRLIRKGKKKQPFFRVVVTDKKNAPRGGRFVEVIGFFNPLTKERGLKADRIKHWISVGAQLSDSVKNLLISEKIIGGKKIPVHNKVTALEEEITEEPKKEEVPAEETKEEAPVEEPKKEEVPAEEAKEEAPVENE